MSVQRIRQLGDPLLRTISTPIDYHEASSLLGDLADTLHEFQRTHGFGRGISAVQIGVAKRVVYIEIEGRSYSMLNPRIVAMSKPTFVMWDDCFSFPNLLVRLERYQAVTLVYEEADGQPCRLEATGAFSELLQHELDHLDGILATDRALPGNSLITREEYERQQLALCEASLLPDVRQNSGGAGR